jgi:hypothetical protein
MRIDINKLKPGDRLVTAKSSIGLVKHHGICLGRSFDATHLIAENEFGNFVRLVSIEQFLRDYPFPVTIIPFTGQPIDRKKAVQRALDSLGKPYSLIDFNCEHFANLVQFNRSFSTQVNFVLVVLGVLAIAAIIND